MQVETQRKEPLLDNVTRPARNYEMMTILLPDMADEDTQAALDKVRGYITDVNGEISEANTESPWGRRRLAYTIRHESVDYRDGFYVLIRFSAQPTAISDIEREMKLDTRVIRYLLVMDDPKAGEKVTEQPQAATEEASETATEAPTAGASEAPASETTEAPAETTTETATEEAPAEASTETATEEAPAERAETATAVEETAEAIEGEEEPAPADGAESEEDTKES